LRACSGLLIGVTVFVVSGCGGYTYNSSDTYFPTNATHRTEYTLVVEADGQRGKAYSDFGQKRVRVVLFHKGSNLMQEEYTIEAEDLGWKVRWDDFSSPQIRFFEHRDETNTLLTATLNINPVVSRQLP
jgi:hypothetical protein